jgi:outer membrane protein TolC
MNALTPFFLALAVAQAGNAPARPAPQTPPQAPATPAPQPPSRAAPQAGQTLTIQEALQIAATQNLDLQAAQARLRQADELSAKAWSGYLPQIDATGRYLQTDEIELPAGTFGAGTPAIVIQPQFQFTGNVQATQGIIVPQLWYAIPNAKRAEEIARLNVETARREILFGVAQAYYGVAALRRAVDVAERLLELQARQEKDARVRYEAGAVPKVTLIRAEIERARAEQDLKRSQNNYASGRIVLASLLDRKPDFEVVDPPEPPLEGDAGFYEAKALRERSDVLSARLNIDLQRGTRNGVIARYFPSLGAFASGSIANEAGFGGQRTNWTAGLALSWRIFDGGLRESDLREANARIDEAEATAGSAELRASQEVQTAFLDLDSARANAAKAKEQRDLAAENQRLVDVAFRAGTATAVEQADAATQLRNAEVALITESLNAQLAAVRVLKSAGTFRPTRP